MAARMMFGLFALATISPAIAKPARCQAGGIDIARNVDVVEAYRAYKGDDGQSHVERIKMPGKKGVFYGGTVHVTLFDLGDPSGASFVYGAPNMTIPLHPVPYRETFIILSGSSEVLLADGTSYRLSRGSMFIADDLGTPGRSGKSGPCGYVALSLAFKDPAKK